MANPKPLSSKLRNLATSHLDYSRDLVKHLAKHSTKLENIYSKLHALNKRKVRKNKCYEKFYEPWKDLETSDSSEDMETER